MIQPLLETKGIKKYFPVTKGLVLSKITGWVKAVDDIDMVIGTGETIGLVGESGCGKTTIAKLILLLEELTAGSILFQGQNIKDFDKKSLSKYRKAVQAVFQNPFSSLDPRLHVGDIIKEPLLVDRTLDNNEINTKVSDALETVGLDSSAASKFPHEFSGGQKQRIAIARALASDPRLIILDEPVSSQDVSIRAQLLNLLKDLQTKLSISYLFIVHDLATVRYMSHRIMVMYLGQMVEVSKSDDLYTQTLHPYTKALLSASLPDRPDSKRTKNVLSGEVPSPLNPPTGCRFHTRCSFVKDICSQEKPELKEVYPDHYVSCYLY